MAWSKLQHEIAKDRGWFLGHLEVYGHYAKRGSYTFAGPLDAEDVKILDRCLLALSRRTRKKKPAKAKRT